MTLKLAWRNVRRSGRDYAIYFITLALGVAVFYAFNSLGSQTVLFDAQELSAAKERMLDMLNYFMGFFSVAVAVVLAFLVVYANRFLLTRRKREFGMYLTLGMRSGQMARILLCETALVGAGALVIGLLLGVLLSQALSFATAALMETVMGNYHFIVSTKALVMTLACFLLIFVLSAIVDVVYISRRKLASLLSAHGSDKPAKRISPLPRTIVFLVSLAIIAAAYYELHINGMVEIPDKDFIAATVLVIIGTFLFFWSLAGFVIALARRWKGKYFKGLSMFTLSQFSTKVNTAFASMAVISFLLFLAMTVTSCGLGMIKAFVGDVEENTRYDASITALAATYDASDEKGEWTPDKPVRFMNAQAKKAGEASNWNMAEAIGSKAPSWNKMVKDSAQLDYYYTGQFYPALLDQLAGDEKKNVPDIESARDMMIRVVSLDQVNACLALLDEDPIRLEAGQFVLNNTLDSADAACKALAKKGATLEVMGSTLTCAPETVSTPLRVTAMNDVLMEVIVSQDVVDSLKAAGAVPAASYLQIVYKGSRAEGDALMGKVLGEAFPVPTDQGVTTTESWYTETTWPLAFFYTAQDIIDQASGLRMAITYLAVYIGFVLLVCTAAILAIQQMSETADSLPRYHCLSTLGSDRKAVFKSLRTQTLTYFLAPLALAACHTACACLVISNTLFESLGVNISVAMLAAAGLVIVVYACYLAISYFTSKSLVKGVLK